MFAVEGTVSSGLKKAEKFMEKETYSKQYKDKLGFIPYNGTLNIKLKDNITLDITGKLSNKLKKINGDNVLGDVLFLESTIYTEDKKIEKEGAILFPEKTVYKTNLLEFIADEKLRDSMHLKDEDTVFIYIDDE